MNAHEKNRYDALLAEAMRKGVSESLARSALAITRRRLGSVASRSSRRAEAYFWAVVRRRAIRDRSTSELTGRLVLGAVVDDLRAAGRDAEGIRAELERGWRGSVSDAVLDDVARSLCA